MLTDTQAKHIIENGKIYMPATSHYAHLYQKQIVVSCDYCSKSNLKICIGLVQQDLCLDCAQRIADVFNSNKYIKHTESLGGIRPWPLSRMIQDSVVSRQTPSPYIVTNMMQDSVVPTTNMMQDSIVATTNMMQESVRDTSAVTDYKNAYAEWQVKYNNYITAKQRAQEKHHAFICVEPPEKPKLEDYLN